ncbi:hypothetical protein [Cytobacillus kochii]|uniref:hypothetical protein n=1 Tax=Cytobacillus kochii TaxID=859143 RepID=UPI00402AF353
MNPEKRKRLGEVESKLQNFIFRNIGDEVKEEELVYVLSKLAFSYSFAVIREEDER